jgi:Tol biopolymer transport system component
MGCATITALLVAQRIVRNATTLNFSADGRRIAFSRAYGIGLARADGGDRSWLLDHAPQDNQGSDWAALSPDGRQVALTVSDADPYGTNAYVIGVDGTNRRLIAEHGSQPMFSPDRTRIAYIKHLAVGESEAPGMAIETVATDGTDRGRWSGTASPPAYSYQPPRAHRLLAGWHPAGRPRIWTPGRAWASRIVIVDAQTGERKRLPARVTGPVGDVVWSPDGRRLAYIGAYPGRVFTIRPDGTGKRVAFCVPVSKYGGIDALAWQPSLNSSVSR